MFVQFSQSPPHICCVVVVVSHYEALIDSSVSFFSTVAGVFWFHPLYRFDGNVWLPESNSHVAGYAQIIPRQRWNMLKYARRRIVLNLHVAWARMPRVRSDTYCNGVLVMAFSFFAIPKPNGGDDVAVTTKAQILWVHWDHKYSQ